MSNDQKNLGQNKYFRLGIFVVVLIGVLQCSKTREAEGTRRDATLKAEAMARAASEARCASDFKCATNKAREDSKNKRSPFFSKYVAEEKRAAVRQSTTLPTPFSAHGVSYIDGSLCNSDCKDELTWLSSMTGVSLKSVAESHCKAAMKRTAQTTPHFYELCVRQVYDSIHNQLQKEFENTHSESIGDDYDRSDESAYRR